MAGLARPHWDSLARPLHPVLAGPKGLTDIVILSWEGPRDLHQVPLTLRAAEAQQVLAGLGWGGRPALECVLGGWPALG